ncbi:hypothetical protein FQS74_005147, partial [Escherichia coli]|nr:hypothetical protein [Escherichia coli]
AGIFSGILPPPENSSGEWVEDVVPGGNHDTPAVCGNDEGKKRWRTYRTN